MEIDSGADDILRERTINELGNTGLLVRASKTAEIDIQLFDDLNGPLRQEHPFGLNHYRSSHVTGSQLRRSLGRQSDLSVPLTPASLHDGGDDRQNRSTGGGYY